MEVARTVWHDIASDRSRVAHRRMSGGLLGLALLAMMGAAEVTWLLTGSPESVNIVAAAEGIYLPQ